MLQDVLVRIAADAGLTDRRRHDLCSALRQVGRALGVQLAEIPAHPGYLRERLSLASPAAVGLSKRRWVNVVSLLRASLKHAGLSKVPGRYVAPMTAGWDQLFRSINDRTTRWGLSRFAHYCSGAGIAPEQVDDAVMGSFHTAISEAGIVRNPREVHRVACRTWNRISASRQVGSMVTEPCYVQTYTLPWTAFPLSLKDAADRYLARLTGADLLDDERDLRPMRASSIAMRERQLRVLASALVLRGRNPQSLLSLADLVEVDAFKDGLRFLIERNGNKTSVSIQDLAFAMLAVARHEVKLATADLDRLRTICRKLGPGGRGLTDKNRALLRQFDDEDNLAALLHLPERMLVDARRRGTPNRATALVVQIALAIEFELMVPMRIGNLARLEIDRHLPRTRSRGRGVRHLVIPGGEVKTGVPIEVPLPTQLVALLDLYIRMYRPLLADAPGPFLFPGKGGKAKGRAVLGFQISRAIRERIGLKVNPHAFRHIATKIGLAAEPGNYGMMRLVMGHKSVTTTERHYAGTEGPVAVQHFDAHVLRLRERLAAGALPRRKGTDLVERP
jgi:integrase